MAEGTLEVTLRKGNNLKDVDFLGKQDPYCVVSLGPISQRSKTAIDGGKSPSWNETFKFLGVRAEDTLKIEIFDENLVFRDVSIGACKIPLRNVIANGAEEVNVPVITKKNKHRGDISLNLKFATGGPAPPLATHGSAPLPTSVKTVTDMLKPGAWILETYGGKDCWQYYDPGEVLGKGTFGTTYLGTDKTTGEKVAVKVISKTKLTSTLEIDDMRREVQIMHHLAGHANVVNIKNVFEDKSNVCIVMELCCGGELFDAIVKKGHYTERDAAALIRTMVSVVAHCHNMGVIHRDLKPENFLLSDTSQCAVLKATDFGLSAFFQEGQIFTDIVGSPFYVAPEVLRRAYGKEADLWSCGVILYILLCGRPPFHGVNEQEIFKAVLNNEADFQSDPWPKISDPAKDAVRQLLVRDPKQRATAAQILKHEWMRENGCASDAPLQIEVLSRIKKFSAMNRLKKQALKVIASNLPLDEITGMKEIFMEMDQDKNGTLTVAEFAEALRKKGKNIPQHEITGMLKNADIDGDGKIDYGEFLAATINLGKLEREEHLRTAFATFDLDGNGFISRKELRQALAKLKITEKQIVEIMQEVDKDGDGEIDYIEFCQMMRDMDM